MSLSRIFLLSDIYVRISSATVTVTHHHHPSQLFTVLHYAACNSIWVVQLSAFQLVVCRVSSDSTQSYCFFYYYYFF